MRRKARTVGVGVGHPARLLSVDGNGRTLQPPGLYRQTRHGDGLDAMVSMLVSKKRLEEAKADLKERIRSADLTTSGSVQAFADQSERIRVQLKVKLEELDPQEFGGVLRPVFQKDEWKLVLAGGVIGTGIGFLQVVYLFG